MSVRLARSVLALVLLAVAGVAGQVATAGPAAADGGRVCYAQEVGGISGGVSYHVTCVDTVSRGGGGQGGGGGGGSVPDTCGLAKWLTTAEAVGDVTPAWCEGASLCQLHDPPTEADPGDLAKYGKLTPPARVIEVFCAELDMGDAGGFTLAIGGVQTPRQLLARADDAYGNLRAPKADVHTSPESPAVIRLDTWFWLGAASFREIRGSSADGMVAIATPQDTTWDPGDGSGSITCAGAGTPNAGGCQHTYTRASFPPRPTTDAKGNPAYAATVTRTYTVRYEFFGQPVVVPGSRLDFAVTTQFPLAVQEVQVENAGQR